MLDNAFDYIENFSKAQELCDNIDIKKIHKRLDHLARKYCPVLSFFNHVYHWSIMQVEYATDIVFKKQEYLQNIYSELTATAIHTVKPDNVATFLGHKVAPRYQGEIGNNYNIRNYKGFNLFSEQDLSLLLTVLRGEYNISGFRNKDIRMRLPQFNTGKISRLIKRLNIFGLIKKVGKTYKYYLTKLGKEVVIAAEKLKQTVLIPALDY